MKKKINKGRRMNMEYHLDSNDRPVMLNFLLSNMTAREAGDLLGISHTQVFNVALSLVRSWIRSGKIDIDPERIFPGSVGIVPDGVTSISERSK